MCLQGELKGNEFQTVRGPQRPPWTSIVLPGQKPSVCVVNKKRNAPNQKHYFKLLQPV